MGKEKPVKTLPALLEEANILFEEIQKAAKENEGEYPTFLDAKDEELHEMIATKTDAYGLLHDLIESKELEFKNLKQAFEERQKVYGNKLKDFKNRVYNMMDHFEKKKIEGSFYKFQINNAGGKPKKVWLKTAGLNEKEPILLPYEPETVSVIPVWEDIPKEFRKTIEVVDKEKVEKALEESRSKSEKKIGELSFIKEERGSYLSVKKV